MSDINVSGEYPSQVSKSVTVTQPVPKSGVNTLQTLSVSPGSLSPAFSPSREHYTVSVGPDVSHLTVSATVTDSKARVSGGGTVSLDEGENTIKLVVTAESGDKRTYTIVATRAAVTPTPEPTLTPEPTPTPPITVMLPDGPYQIIEVPAGVSIPAGFYRSLATIEGQMVPVYKSLQGELTLYYLYSQSGGDGFYYLDQQTDRYIPYLVLSVPAQSFTVLTPDESVAEPEGWTPSTMTIAGKTLPVWKKTGEDQSIYLVYLMDARGNQSFYRYDMVSQLLLPYEAAQSGQTDPQPTEPVASVTPLPTELTASPDQPNPWTLATAIMGLICLALIGVLIWQGARGTRDAGGRNDRNQLPPPPPIKRI